MTPVFDESIELGYLRVKLQGDRVVFLYPRSYVENNTNLAESGLLVVGCHGIELRNGRLDLNGSAQTCSTLIVVSSSSSYNGRGRGLVIGWIDEFLSNRYLGRLPIHNSNPRSAQKVRSLLTLECANEEVCLGASQDHAAPATSHGQAIRGCVDEWAYALPNTDLARKARNGVGQVETSIRVVGYADDGIPRQSGGGMGGGKGPGISGKGFVEGDDGATSRVDNRVAGGWVHRVARVPPLELPIEADFIQRAFLNLEKFCFYFNLATGIRIEPLKNSLDQVEGTPLVGDDHLEAVEDELVALGLVERDTRSFQKRLDLGSLVVGTSSGASSRGGSERIGSPSSCTGSPSGHPVDRSLGKLVEFGFKQPLGTHDPPGLRDHDCIRSYVVGPVHHLGNKGDHLPKRHGVKGDGNVGWRFVSLVKNDDVHTLFGRVGFGQVKRSRLPLQFGHDLREGRFEKLYSGDVYDLELFLQFAGFARDLLLFLDLAIEDLGPFPLALNLLEHFLAGLEVAEVALFLTHNRYPAQHLLGFIVL